MESLKRKELIQELERYGYGLMHTEKKSPEELIPDIIKSGEPRLIYAIPIILLNTAPEELNLEAMSGRIPKRLTSGILYLTLLLYREESIAMDLQDKLLRYTGEIPELSTEFSRGGNIEILPKLTINARSLRENFRNYLLLQKRRDMLSEKIGLSLEMKTRHQLSRLFSKKQREILLKKLNQETLTKTEKEYFSRTIKPKLEAILNPEIKRIASLMV